MMLAKMIGITHIFFFVDWKRLDFDGALSVVDWSELDARVKLRPTAGESIFCTLFRRRGYDGTVRRVSELVRIFG